MMPPDNVLVFHTAFPGDIILTLPMISTLHRSFPQARITAVVVPTSAGVLLHHPALNEVIVYDKRGVDRGIRGIARLALRLRRMKFDLAVVPHRSIRSATVAWAARIPRRIGFSRSPGRFLFTDVVADQRDIQEIQRNLSLLRPLGITPKPGVRPELYPDQADVNSVDRLLRVVGFAAGSPMVALAPGSKWNTKRWPAEQYAALGKLICRNGLYVALVGGAEDLALCASIASAIGEPGVLNGAGQLTVLQSAELIRRSRVLVSNDSAPVHIASAVGTPVLAIFGPTSPSFGFAPTGEQDEVIERLGLDCRPCSIHGGERCPIGTFVCMKEITPDMVYTRVLARIRSIPAEM